MTSRNAVDFGRIWPLQAAAAGMLAAGGLHFTLTPAHGQTLGFDNDALGLIGSAYYAGFLAGSLLNALAFRALGHRVLFTVYAAAIALAVAVQSILTDVAAWMMLRAATGFLAAGLFAAIESWLNAVANNANRGRTLSAYTITNQASLAAGQALFLLFPASSGAGFLLSGGLLLLTAIPFAGMRGTPPPVSTRTRIRLVTLAKGSPVAFAGFLTNGLATAPFWTLGPVFARDSGLSQSWIALFMALPIFGSLVSQWPVARYSDRVDRRKVILPVALFAAGASAGLASAAQWGAAWMIFPGIFIFGSTAFLLNMLCSSHMNDRVAEQELTEAAGASFVVYGIASALGPLTASAAIGLMGSAGLFWHGGIVLLAFAVFTASRIAARA